MRVNSHDSDNKNKYINDVINMHHGPHLEKSNRKLING